ncbi:ABC transporter permease subunit [Lysinibacillus sp. BPa_S21]|uniref:ABC transporter permease subunit n=1 Tax=Lysinibacillus sp. BPa_S21 TaxID=2932478 RepID=UPI002011FB3B|nr:ABC transporter permease subunit [Lysinibacillus sp. BPa_S21]MCL1698362.1 ABC transporter permease subunit [Lysinibacillus sp. BPa_S21]
MSLVRKENVYVKRLFSLTLLLIIGLLGLFAPIIMPHDPLAIDISKKFLGPSLDYPLGTDHLGRCVWSRMLLGIRYSLGSALIIQIVAILLAVLLGAFVALKRGLIDFLFIRICDILLAFPTLVLAFGLLGLLGPSLKNVFIALIFTQLVYYSRWIRGLFIGMNEKGFIQAARISGTSGIKLIMRHYIPNLLPPIVTIVVLDIGKVILEIAGFSFIGLGVHAPIPEWGMMVNEGKQYIRQHPELMLYPGLAIVLVVLLLNHLASSFKKLGQ